MKTHTKALILGGLLVAVVVTLSLKDAQTRQTEEIPAGVEPGTPISTEPVPASYGSSAPGLPRIAALGAGRCIPCKAMEPIRAELRQEYEGQLAVDFYDVWKDPEAGRHFRIRAIPTLIFYEASGRELGRREGFRSKADILTTLQSFGIDLTLTGVS